MLVTLVDNLIKSRTELQNIIKEKSNALEDEKIKNDKISELEAKNVQEIKHYEDLEAEIKRIAKAHKDEVAKLKEELANANENFEVEKAKRENFSDKKDQLQKIVDQLQNLREDCFSIGAQCCQRLSDNFHYRKTLNSRRPETDGNKP
jgi:DNA repair exonuclease SbcCD ATPase subunit